MGTVWQVFFWPVTMCTAIFDTTGSCQPDTEAVPQGGLHVTMAWTTHSQASAVSCRRISSMFLRWNLADLLTSVTCTSIITPKSKTAPKVVTESTCMVYENRYFTYLLLACNIPLPGWSGAIYPQWSWGRQLHWSISHWLQQGVRQGRHNNCPATPTPNECLPETPTLDCRLSFQLQAMCQTQPQYLRLVGHNLQGTTVAQWCFWLWWMRWPLRQTGAGNTSTTLP